LVTIGADYKALFVNFALKTDDFKGLKLSVSDADAICLARDLTCLIDGIDTLFCSAPEMCRNIALASKTYCTPLIFDVSVKGSFSFSGLNIAPIEISGTICAMFKNKITLLQCYPYCQ